MNNNTFSLKFNDGNEVLLFKNIHGPLYPFAMNNNTEVSTDIIDYWKD